MVSMKIVFSFSYIQGQRVDFKVYFQFKSAGPKCQTNLKKYFLWVHLKKLLRFKEPIFGSMTHVASRSRELAPTERDR